MSRSNVARLLVSCPDREGIVASLSTALRDAGANIISSDQFSSDPYGGSFSLRMEFYLPNPDERFPALEQRLAEIGTGARAGLPADRRQAPQAGGAVRLQVRPLPA